MLRRLLGRPFSSRISLPKQWAIVDLAQRLHDPATSKYTILPSKTTLEHTSVSISAFRDCFHKGQLDPCVVAALDSLHFVWDARAHAFNQKRLALEIYQREYGHTIVPINYIVPANDPAWPKELWHLRLGKAVDNFRSRGISSLSSAHVDALDALGFVWNAQDDTWQRNVDALTRFKALFGHTRVPEAFVVPSDEPWPKQLHGFRLGVFVHAVRARQDRLSTDRKEDMDDLGLQLNTREVGWQTFVAALKVFRREHHHVCVPKSYVTADGLKLGVFVRNARHRVKSLTPARKETLDALGFKWTLPTTVVTE
ncbi:Aste57867_10935 [Aphanomyces stellatus]|uniref:Aste57867_10935 protein n=1 Tax=Aphanomyces stellatus TaxID=120398 RepID=A0A485KRS0_9STRA|nr:hypothetical protein As57867_010895 [Aphanomyces stellatus]VFT87803.1 Aste57867_10935 [Aphanomyces stellatus]